jgi:hypothetical protein
VCFEKHAGFAQSFGRTYWKWALFSPVEFALFMGVPVACLVLWRLARQVRIIPALKASRDKLSQTDIILWSLVLTFVILDVSGKSLGEVSRLWMFLMPFGALVAAEEVSGWHRYSAVAAILTLLMFMQWFVFSQALNVFGTMG